MKGGRAKVGCITDTRFLSGICRKLKRENIGVPTQMTFGNNTENVLKIKQKNT